MNKNNTGKWLQFWIYAAFVVLFTGAVFHIWNYCFPHNRLIGPIYIIIILILQLLDHVKSIITGKKVVWND